jgi:hypothetical protein
MDSTTATPQLPHCPLGRTGAEQYTPETPKTKKYDPGTTALVNVFWICVALAIADLVLREDPFGFILPGAYFFLWVAGLTFSGMRHMGTSSKSADFSGDKPTESH